MTGDRRYQQSGLLCIDGCLDILKASNLVLFPIFYWTTVWLYFGLYSLREMLSLCINLFDLLSILIHQLCQSQMLSKRINYFTISA